MKKFIWPVATGALTAFLITTYFVNTGSQLAFDTVIQEAIFSLRAGWLDPLVIALTHLGDTESIVAICAVLLILPRTRIHYGLPVSAAAIAASSLNHYLKAVFERPRPDVTYHIIEQGGWSFPSGHSISALVVFGLLILLIRYHMIQRTDTAREAHQNKTRCSTDPRTCANILTAILLIPCLGIGLSRIYVGVHYPTDVLAGWCLGIVILVIALGVIESIERKINGKH